MKIIKKKEREDSFFIEKYDLNGAYAGQRDIPIGVMLLYILIEDTEFEFVELVAEAEGEPGEPYNILKVSNKQKFENMKDITEPFKQQKLKIWRLTGRYSGEEIYITGQTYGTILSVSTPLTARVNMLPLMSEVELVTYDYHTYDKYLVEAMKQRFRMNQKTAIKMLLDLEQQPDIYNEFVSGMQKGTFVFPDKNPIEVEGYTADKLHNEFPLSELGAYNYLIYLRKNPKDGLEDLRNGLPRK